MATRLFALDGVQVAEVDAEAGGGRTVWVVTADPGAAASPGCGTVSARVKEHVTTRPADLRHGQDPIAVRWVKRRWECREPSCPRPTFTESVAAVPPRPAWIAKEKLRDVLSLRARVTGSVPWERAVRGRLTSFYDWCAQNDDIPELLTLARTVSRWENEIVAAVLTGVTNARSESLNRLAKLQARMAYSFRNPANQRRRVRTACTRSAGRPRIATPRPSLKVTGRPPDTG